MGGPRWASKISTPGGRRISMGGWLVGSAEHAKANPGSIRAREAYFPPLVCFSAHQRGGGGVHTSESVAWRARGVGGSRGPPVEGRARLGAFPNPSRSPLYAHLQLRPRCGHRAVEVAPHRSSRGVGNSKRCATPVLWWHPRYHQGLRSQLATPIERRASACCGVEVLPVLRASKQVTWRKVGCAGLPRPAQRTSTHPTITTDGPEQLGGTSLFFSGSFHA